MKINKNVKKGIMPYILLAVFALFILIALDFAGQKVNVLTYDEFEGHLVNNEIEEIEITPRGRAKVYEISGKIEGYDKKESFFVRVPFSEEVMSRILLARKMLVLNLKLIRILNLVHYCFS